MTVQPVNSERNGVWDLYSPEVDGPRPVIVFVHGGPIPMDLPVSPRDWPVYRGYSALAARAGLVGVTIDHPLHSYDAYPAAYAEVLRAIGEVRTDPRVDGDRVAVWCFSGGGPLISPLLLQPPQWLRCVAASYPVLASRADRELPGGFRPIDALTPRCQPPIVLTRVGLEAQPIATGVSAFLSQAQNHGVHIDIVDVPHGHHAFDVADPGPESTAAVNRALELVTAAISR